MKLEHILGIGAIVVGFVIVLTLPDLKIIGGVVILIGLFNLVLPGPRLGELSGLGNAQQSAREHAAVSAASPIPWHKAPFVWLSGITVVVAVLLWIIPS